jgi:hypothetical protein
MAASQWRVMHVPERVRLVEELLCHHLYFHVPMQLHQVTVKHDVMSWTVWDFAGVTWTLLHHCLGWLPMKTCEKAAQSQSHEMEMASSHQMRNELGRQRSEAAGIDRLPLLLPPVLLDCSF